MSGFSSVLFPYEVPLAELDTVDEPAYFGDLNLDQLVAAVCGRYSADRLAPYFRMLLPDEESVVYRQQVLAEAERPDLNVVLDGFERAMQKVGSERSLGRQVRYKRQKQRCLLDAATIYCAAVVDLAAALAGLTLESAGLRGLRGHLDALTGSEPFRALHRDARNAQEALDQVAYTLQIEENRVRVDVYDHQPDLGEEVVDLFARFREHDLEHEQGKHVQPSGFSHVEASILEHVAALFPGPFEELARFCDEHADHVDPVVARFRREVCFLLAWAGFRSRMESAGLTLCYPSLSPDHTWRAGDCYDLALASVLTDNHDRKAPPPDRHVVTNELDLVPPEHTLVLTGPNQGGKTTYARMVGQLAHLAATGCPVPGRDVQVPLVDQIFVLFEREESVGTLRGKLQDDLLRTREIVAGATSHSLAVLNEMFSSTTSDDAAELARLVIDQLVDRGCVSVCVTFLDELADYRDGVVSLVAEVDPDDPSRRTFEVTRRPADGRAYAEAIARKYHLTAGQVSERFTPGAAS